MPKPSKGPRLGGSAAHQRHIIANLCKDLIRHEAVTTTQRAPRSYSPTWRDSSPKPSAATPTTAAWP